MFIKIHDKDSNEVRLVPVNRVFEIRPSNNNEYFWIKLDSEQSKFIKAVGSYNQLTNSLYIK